MQDPIQEIFNQLDITLNNIAIEEDDILKRSEHSIDKIIASISVLRKHIVSNKFNSNQEEIRFFKQVKPRFVSWLIYHLKVYNIESHRPNGSIKIKRKYIRKELDKLKNFLMKTLTSTVTLEPAAHT